MAIPSRTYWNVREGGAEKRDVHVASKPTETYTIFCASKPTMKSLVVELAE